MAFPSVSRMAPGLALAAGLAALATAAARLPWVATLGLGPLTLAIMLGMAVGNTRLLARFPGHGEGIDLARTRLLRLGIVLYGFRISFQQIGAVGWAGVLIDALMIAATFTLAVQLGTRVFKLDRETAMLIGAGSAICGAAAVMAAEPVVRAPSHKVAVAVATVVVFGTLAMFVYPLLYPWLGMSEAAYGLYAGSTIHEVAQVMVAARAVGEQTAATAVVGKMLRVMMLAPFLLLLARRVAPGAGRPIAVPWFALLFIGASGVHSLALLPAALVDALTTLDAALLATAMAALGLRTQFGAVRQAGARPMLLAALLFAFLLAGGYAINRVVALLL